VISRGSLAAAPPSLFLAGLVALGGLTGLSGCRKRAAPPATEQKPAAATAPGPGAPTTVVNCPGPETFAPVDTAKGRVLHSACVVYAPGRYWLATTLSYDQKTGKSPRLSFLTGGFGPRITIFDVEPIPAEQITKLVTEGRNVGVKIRRTREDTSLVRLGVVADSGDAAKPETHEVGMLLQLVAHAPPKVLWVGPGDQSAVGADGCITEQVVDFELLFRTRLERFTTQRSRPAPGAKNPSCSTGPSMQDSVPYQPVALKKGRLLNE
jgi:hypothetical protein